MSNLAGFYRLYRQDKATSLDEAIALAKEEAVAAGFEASTLEVNRQRTGINEAGYFLVGLLGRTATSLERERAKARKRVAS